MKIVDINPDKLIFYEQNPRENDNAVPIVKNSIERFGFRVPVMITKDNIIICGHTRVKAALELGLKTVPCTIESDMTEEETRAFRIVENKTHEFSFWDKPLLQLEMDSLDDVFNFEDYGFEQIEELTEEDINKFFAENTIPSKSKDIKPVEVECPHCHTRFVPKI
jgi:ParB family transcriptional regulator, chromosome partitioning protein